MDYQVFIHEKYNDGGKDGEPENDIALFKLDKPVDFEVDKHLVPLCLPKSGLNVENMTCFTSGWGATKSSKCTFILPKSIQT